MKTLDEVITGMTELILSGKTADVKSTVRDALHYLKVLKDILDPLKVKKITHEITCPQCQSKIAIFLPESNEPLTWDELKTMEGKPVWYEHEFWKGWIILGKVEQGVNCEMIPDREERWYIVKDGIAKAYRKERE